MNNTAGCSFIEFIEQNKAEAWVDALRVFMNVMSPIEEKSREEWEEGLERLKNKQCK